MSDDAIAQAWQDIYNSPQGRTAINGLMESLGLYDEIRPMNSMDAGIMIGERNVASRIAVWCKRKPEAFVDDAVEDMDALEKFMKANAGD
jgi:hypothetical protein